MDPTADGQDRKLKHKKGSVQCKKENGDTTESDQLFALSYFYFLVLNFLVLTGIGKKRIKNKKNKIRLPNVFNLVLTKAYITSIPLGIRSIYLTFRIKHNLEII